MFRFRLSSFLLVIALLAVFLGWLLDHQKLKARNELLNREAIQLMESHISEQFSNLPFSPLGATDIQLDGNYDTYEHRELVRQQVKAVLAGVNGRSVHILKGTELTEAFDTLQRLGFEGKQQPDKGGYIRFRKPWGGGYHHVTMQAEDEKVTSVMEMCIDP